MTVVPFTCLPCTSAVVTQVSTVLGVAIKEEREQKAWSEGVAIWVAVIVVSLVGEQNLIPQAALVGKIKRYVTAESGCISPSWGLFQPQAIDCVNGRLA